MKFGISFRTGMYAPYAILGSIKDRRIKRPRRIGWQMVWVNES